MATNLFDSNIGTGGNRDAYGNFLGSMYPPSPYSIPADKSKMQLQIGNVLGQNTGPQAPVAPTAPAGGGGGVFVPQGTPAMNVPGTPEYNANIAGGGGQPPEQDFQSLIAGPLEALSQQEAALQGALPTDIGFAEQQAGSQKAGITGQQKLGQQSFGNQRTAAQGERQSAIAEARRQASEIQQGIQSRYGSTTGTGAFTSELLGRQAMKTIADYNQSYQGTLSKIGEAENSLNLTVTNKITDIDQTLTLNKQRLQDQLKKDLADISYKRGELESRKAEARMQALQNYASIINQQAQQANQFKQQLALQAQKSKDALAEIKARSEASFQLAIQRQSLSNPEVPVYSINPITGQMTSQGNVPSKARLINLSTQKDAFGNPITGATETPQPAQVGNGGMTPDEAAMWNDTLGQ